MAFPLIGITTSKGIHADQDILYLMKAYATAVVEAGGVPAPIPSGLPEEILLSLYDRLDGILFSGGGDVNPECYGAVADPSVHDVSDERDAVEIALLKLAVKDGKPFLGICRGIQIINAGMGGTLYVDIHSQLPEAIEHKYSSKTHRSYLAHPVEVAADSRLAQILGETNPQVNSMHHQGVKDIPAGLLPVAYAADGMVEALEAPGHPFGIAVQWHPECLPDQLPMRRLFRAFIEAADAYRKK